MEELTIAVAIVASTVAVTLGIVAMWFTNRVERRSREVTEQTIRSMQIVEASVAAQGRETQRLFQAAWDRISSTTSGQLVTAAPDTSSDSESFYAWLRTSAPPALLAGPGAGPEVGTEEPSSVAEPRPNGTVDVPGQRRRRHVPHEITREVTREVISDVPDDEAKDAPGAPPADVARDVSGDQAKESARDGDLTALDHWVQVLNGFDPITYELARALDHYGTHLERDHYLGLARHRRTGPAVRELRRAGLLAPLSSRSDDDRPLTYGCPPGLPGPVGAAFGRVDRREPKAARLVQEVLTESGFLRRDGDRYLLAQHHDDS